MAHNDYNLLAAAEELAEAVRKFRRVHPAFRSLDDSPTYRLLMLRLEQYEEASEARSSAGRPLATPYPGLRLVDLSRP